MAEYVLCIRSVLELVCIDVVRLPFRPRSLFHATFIWPREVLFYTFDVIIFLFARFIEEISPDVVEKFRDFAQVLVEKLGAVEALAAALAHISNTKEIKSRSLITGEEVCFVQ